jgi:predicted ATPase
MRRVAVFAGDFTAEAASLVAAGGEIAASEVVRSLANLVTKSLVTLEVGSEIALYRPHETTRAYAIEKLAESGEFKEVARRHANYYRDLFDRAEMESETLPVPAWLAGYGRQIGQVRAALDWAFSPTGAAEVGVALTVAAVPLWVHLSLMEEYRSRVEQALFPVTHPVSPLPNPRTKPRTICRGTPNVLNARLTTALSRRQLQIRLGCSCGCGPRGTPFRSCR